MSFQSKKQALPERLAELCLGRIKLLDNGYEPIPIRGKLSYITGWPGGDIDHDRIIRETSNHIDHPNTGLRCGRLVGVDIDLRDDEHAEFIRELVEKIAGPTPLRRRGSKGMMLCYQKIGPPIPKIIISEKVPVPTEDNPRPKAKTLVEIFGTNTQFVAFGIHPDTHQPYRWLEPDQNPFTVPLENLPGVDTETIHALWEGIPIVLTALGYEVGTQNQRTHDGPARVPGEAHDAVDITELFLARIPSVRRTSRGYYNFTCPACGCDDKRAGFRVLSNGGFDFKCFHTGCEFYDSSGWQPPSRYVGKRVVKLYELLGGDPDDLKPNRRMLGVQSLSEMMAEFRGANA